MMTVIVQRRRMLVALATFETTSKEAYTTSYTTSSSAYCRAAISSAAVTVSQLPRSLAQLPIVRRVALNARL